MVGLIYREPVEYCHSRVFAVVFLHSEYYINGAPTTRMILAEAPGGMFSGSRSLKSIPNISLPQNR